LDRFGLVAVPVTVVEEVTSDPSVGLLMLTTGPGPVTGPNTRNPLFAKVACSAPVVTVTGALNPGAAPESIVICAVAVEELVTVTGPAEPRDAPPTEIPGPKVACVTPCWKFVNIPLIATEIICPGCAWDGERVEIVGGPVVAKPLMMSACSDPVRATTVRRPRTLLLGTLTCAMAVVGLVTWTGP
jgi:hypothetical protein